MSEAIEYPPGTAPFLSWAALRFITRPSPRALLWTAIALMSLLGVAAVTLPFVKVDQRVPGQGAVDADPGSVEAAALEDGTVDARLVEPGAIVTKGQPLAALQLGPGGESLRDVMRGLSANPALLRRVSVDDARVPAAIQGGGSLEYFPDSSVREHAAALDEAMRKLDMALRNRVEFGGPRDEAAAASVRLAGAVTEYLEGHTVRAPASGTLLQYQTPLHARVSKGQAVAIVLPRDARLIAKITVDPRHAAGLSPGQAVHYKLDAYPYERYGLFEGRVLRIEQATDAQRGLYYVVRATIEPPGRFPGLRLLVGMNADASLVLGRRRLWELAVQALLGKR